MTATAIAVRHCRAAGNKLTLAGFASEIYGISDRELRLITRGKRKPSRQTLLRMHAAHVRLLPSEPLDLPLPDGSVAHLGGDTLFISFPDGATPEPPTN